MHPVIGRCPVCDDNLIVTRLYCRSCDTALEGHFTLGRFYQLTPEQLHFIETFIRCEGKITRVEDELGLSYPTVRSRLMDVIRALGYEVKGAPTLTSEQRRELLNQVAAGTLGAEEAAKLLQGTR